MEDCSILSVIVNADDLGLSDFVNKQIEKGIKDKVISSSTILANGEAFNAVKSIVDKYPDVSFGVHLNIDEFKSLTGLSIFYDCGMMDENGFFIKGAFRNQVFSPELKEAIYQEWKMQILKIVNSGISISHIDGHHHCHTQHELYSVVEKLLHEFGIYKIRQIRVRPLSFRFHPTYELVSSNGQCQIMQKKSLIGKIRNYIKAYCWYKKTKCKYITTDAFFSYAEFFDNVDFFIGRKCRSIELMCHPGHPGYLREQELLFSDVLHKKIHYSLMSYNCLMSGGSENRNYKRNKNTRG